MSAKHVSKAARAASIAVLTGCLLAGCGGAEGPKRAAVRGTVRIDGRPLERGSIVFVPTAGTTGPEAAAEVTNGSYELPEERGPVVGQVRIEIRAAQDLGYALDDPQQFVARGGRIPPPNPIPPEYNERSTLVRQTTAGAANQFDFDIHTVVRR